jgi:hypothetical protein
MVKILKKILENFNFFRKSQSCANESQTKKFLIDPFFNLMRYAQKDLIPEYDLES